MIILDTVNKSLCAVLAGAVAANQPIFTVAYADTDGTTFTEASADGVLNSAVEVELVAVPAVGHRRIIKYISIYNADTAAVVVSIYVKNGASVRIIRKKTLSVGASLQFGLETERDNTDIINVIYPVGSIYTSIVSTNPGTLFGVGTWVAFGTGRTLVGIDVGQAEFDVVEETGGAKTHTLTGNEMPSHSHPEQDHTNRRLGFNDASGTAIALTGTPLNASNVTDLITAAAGGSAAHNNLQPYIVVYMWKRTA